LILEYLIGAFWVSNYQDFYTVLDS